MAPILKILPAGFPEDLGTVKTLMRHYAAHLASAPEGEAAICLTGFETELASLPGPYAEPAGCVYLAFLDGKAVGCFAIKSIAPNSPASPSEKACEMKRLWTEPSARGLGVGRGLMLAAFTWARNAGFTALYLDTVPKVMPAAVRLYKILGFGEIPRYNDNAVPGIAFYRKFLD